MKKIKNFFAKVFKAVTSFFKSVGRGARKCYLFLNSKFKRVDKIRLAFVINTIFALLHGAMSILEHSVWFLMLCIYYLSMALVRGGILTYKKRNEQSELLQLRAYKRCGGFLVLISLALTVAVIQMVYINRTFRYTGLIIYAVATFAFYKITIAIINIVKYKRESDYSVRCIMNINLANALVSMLALQTALLSEFSDSDSMSRTFNALSGSFVCAFTLGLGAFMLVKAKIKLKEIKGN